jgi:hypothetical protein
MFRAWFRDCCGDRRTHGGGLGKALDDARKGGWLFVDMKSDWKFAYPLQG